MHDSNPAPTRSQWLQAAVLAIACSLAFLGAGVLPSRAVVPYPPEALEPLRSEALARGDRSLEELLVGNSTFGDKYFQSLAWDRITRDRLLAGEWPLWTRDIAGGQSFVPQMGQIYQPWNALLLAFSSSIGVYGLWYLLHQVLFGLFGYGFLRRLGVGHEGGLVGLVCLVVGLWTQARVHHNVILSAALPTFVMLGCVHALMRRGAGVGTAGVLGIATGVCWLGGMPQVSLLATFLTVAWAGHLALGRHVEGRRRGLTWTAVGLAVGGAMSLGQMGPVLLAAQQTARSPIDTAGLASASLAPAHLLQALWPDLLHWPAEQYYDGRIDRTRLSWAALLWIDQAKLNRAGVNYPETAFALGQAGLAFAIAALVTAREHLAGTVRFFAVVLAVALAFAMALPSHLALSTGWVPDVALWIPGARAGDPKRWLFLVAMAGAVLAALGADRVVRGERRRAAVVVGGTFGVVALVSAVQLLTHSISADELTERYAALVTADYGLPPDVFRDEVAPGEAEANGQRLRRTFGHALGFGLVGLALVATAFLAAGAWRRVGVVGLALVLAIDLVVVGHGTIVPVERERVVAVPTVVEPALAATRAAEAIGAPRPRFQRLTVRPDEPGIYPLLSPNLGALLGLEDIAAYNPLPPERMQEFVARIDPRASFGGAGIGPFRATESATHPLLDLLGVRWLLAGRALDGPGLVERTPAGAVEPYRLYERTSALPRATFVTRVRVLEDRDARLEELGRRDRDPSGVVVLEDANAPRPESSADGSTAVVDVVDHDDERVVVSVEHAAAGYLRLADPWDPGWTATVDGEPAPVFVADHYLRAVWLPAPADGGRAERSVEFRYDAFWRVRVWPWATVLAAMVAGAGLVVGARRRRRTPVSS